MVKRWWNQPRKFERLALLILVVLYIAGFHSTREATEKIRTEGNERRHQTCLIFEGIQAKDVKKLQATYDYLERYPAQSDLRDAVIKALPQTEDDARFDDAPEYCDEDGIGTPEPDPVVPERPESLRETRGRPASRTRSFGD